MGFHWSQVYSLSFSTYVTQMFYFLAKLQLCIFSHLPGHGLFLFSISNSLKQMLLLWNDIASTMSFYNNMFYYIIFTYFYIYYCIYSLLPLNAIAALTSAFLFPWKRIKHTTCSMIVEFWIDIVQWYQFAVQEQSIALHLTFSRKHVVALTYDIVNWLLPFVTISTVFPNGVWFDEQLNSKIWSLISPSKCGNSKTVNEKMLA